MPFTNPPFRAEHLGSLLRPRELLLKRVEVQEGKASKEELTKLEDRCIKEVVELQKECGFHALSEGEYRRHMFWGTFFETLEGMEEIPLGTKEGFDASIFREYAPDVKIFIADKKIPNSAVVCVAPIRHTGVSSYAKEVEYMQSLVPQSEWGNIKITLISPSWYHYRYAAGRAYPKEVYKNDEEYFADVAKAYQVELGLLYDMGIRNVQVDDPNLAYFCSEAMLKGWQEDKRNDKTADEMFDAYMKFYSACFERPKDMHLGIHLCRGNYRNSKHFSEGAYDRIAEKMFTTLSHDMTFYLEYDTPRAGGFEPLRHLPLSSRVVVGVVTSKFPQLEDQQEMVERIYKAADFVAEGSGQTREEALKRLSVSPQCGFASHLEGNSLGWEDMRNKLKLVRAIADQVWPGEP